MIWHKMNCNNFCRGLFCDRNDSTAFEYPKISSTILLVLNWITIRLNVLLHSGSKKALYSISRSNSIYWIHKKKPRNKKWIEIINSQAKYNHWRVQMFLLFSYRFSMEFLSLMGLLWTKWRNDVKWSRCSFDSPTCNRTSRWMFNKSNCISVRMNEIVVVTRDDQSLILGKLYL